MWGCQSIRAAKKVNDFLQKNLRCPLIRFIAAAVDCSRSKAKWAFAADWVNCLVRKKIYCCRFPDAIAHKFDTLQAAQIIAEGCCVSSG